MAPQVASAKATLSYPVYSSAFDPQNDSFLLVGGGGGEGRSGMGNKITLLDASRKQELRQVVDIDLSREEDSVSSLATVQATERSVIALAGINSSLADQNAGSNEHLRSFKLEYPPQRKRGADDGEGEETQTPEYKGQTRALGRTSYFTPSTAVHKETYQRVLKLSPRSPDGTSVGAIATGLAPSGEIVVFTANSNGIQTPSDICGRIQLEERQEAADLDVIPVNVQQDSKDGDFLLAYCLDYEVYTAKINSRRSDKQLETRLVYGEPHPDSFASTRIRPKLRFVRFLSPDLLLVLQNLPDKKGAQLLLLELPHITSPIARKRLPKSMKSATAFSTVSLHPPSKSYPNQTAVAIAGLDTSILILTLDHPFSSPFLSIKFRTHMHLPLVHPQQMTSLIFSPFSPPFNPSNSPPQYLKLASTSIAYTVVVNTFPLTPYPPWSSTPQKQHYYLRHRGRSETAQVTFSVIIATIVVAIGAIFLQAFTEIRGGTPEYLGVKKLLPRSIHDAIALPYMFEHLQSTAAVPSPLAETSAVTTAIDPPPMATANLKGLLAEKERRTEDDPPSEIHVQAFDYHSLSFTAQHPDELFPEDGPAELDAKPAMQNNEELAQEKPKPKRWHELAEHEKEWWKRKLSEAGHWTADEGEAVLKGVVFSSAAGLIADAVQGVVG